MYVFVYVYVYVKVLFLFMHVNQAHKIILYTEYVELHYGVFCIILYENI